MFKFDKVFIITYLRNSLQEFAVEVAGQCNDFDISNEELENVLRVSLTRIDPKLDLDNVPQENLYDLVLLAKREVLFRLATKNAPLYKISSDTMTIYKADRFEHYISLVQMVDSEIEKSENGGSLTPKIVSGEILLDKNYRSKRNFELSTAPTINAKAVQSLDYIDVSWSKFNVESNNKFSSYKVYVGTYPIVSDFSTKEDEVFSISEKANLVATIKNIHKTSLRLVLSSLLTPPTSVVVVVEDLNTLKGYSEVNLTATPIA